MIYLIGGTPRVGKSTLAQMILERNKISWMPLDTVREALSVVSPNLGIQEGKDWWISHHDKFFPFLKELVDNIRVSKMSHVIEGDSFLPRHAKDLIERYQVKVCFLGVSRLDLDTLKTFRGAGDYWLENLPEKELEDLPSWIITRSNEYKSECEEIEIQYFDVSNDHARTLEDAYGYLMKN